MGDSQARRARPPSGREREMDSLVNRRGRDTRCVRAWPKIELRVVRGHGMARRYCVSRLAQFRLLLGQAIHAIPRTEVIVG